MIQNNFKISIRKTTVVNIDDSAHALPPDNGPFQEFKVADYFCPDEWSKDGVFIPVKESEPLWIDLRGNDECACIPSIQRLNPITGEPADLEKGLTKETKQNYLVLPDQRWLDGYAKDGKVYQFMVTKAGEGLAVSEYVLPKHMQDLHALGFAFFSPKNPKPKMQSVLRSSSVWHSDPNWYSPLHTPNNWTYGSKGSSMGNLGKLGSHQVYTSGGLCSSSAPIQSDGPEPATWECNSLDCDTLDRSMGDVYDVLEATMETVDKASMGMGGRIEQSIITDSNSVEYYKEKPDVVVSIYMALPEQFELIMKKGRRQDASKKDKYTYSGEVGGIQVPLVKSK